MYGEWRYVLKSGSEWTIIVSLSTVGIGGHFTLPCALFCFLGPIAVSFESAEFKRKCEEQGPEDRP